MKSTKLAPCLAACIALVAAIAGKPAHASPAGSCETSPARATPHGTISRTKCVNAQGVRINTINIDSVPVLSDAELFKDEFSDKYGYFLFSPAAQWETGCADRLYLVDLSRRPVKVIAFGVKKACNEFQWASWGERRSVIALKNNVKFTNENGVMTLPKAGEALWNAIEPPHAGPGLSEEDAIPFAEDVPLPK